MTNSEQLKVAINTLSSIRTPIAFTESIAIPVYQAIMLINSICEKIEKEENSQEDVSISNVKFVKEKPEDAEELPSEGVLYVDDRQNENDTTK